MIKQRESEIDTIERQNVEIANEKSQIEAALQKAELDISEFQNETGQQLQNLQADFKQQITSLKEELAQSVQNCETLKNVVDQREQELLTKSQVEQDSDNTRAESQAVKMANDEYRRVLKAKMSELMQLKRDQEAGNKTISLKIKELEFELQQEKKKVEALQTENEQLLKSVTFEKTQNITIDRELQNKEETLEEQQEKFEKELKERTKQINDLNDELTVEKKKNEEITERLGKLETDYSNEVKNLKNQIRKK